MSVCQVLLLLKILTMYNYCQDQFLTSAIFESPPCVSSASSIGYVPVGAAAAGAQCWQGASTNIHPPHDPQMREWVKCHPMGSLQIEREVLHLQNKNRKLYQEHSNYKKRALKNQNSYRNVKVNSNTGRES